eukprot:5088448-Amphidinium_carterae.1
MTQFSHVAVGAMSTPLVRSAARTRQMQRSWVRGDNIGTALRGAVSAQPPCLCRSYPRIIASFS